MSSSLKKENIHFGRNDEAEWFFLFGPTQISFSIAFMAKDIPVLHPLPAAPTWSMHPNL